MKVYALMGAMGLHGALPLISQTSTDPVSTFAPLGITGIVSIILYLWQRETSKKLDKSTELNAELVPLLTRVLDVIQASNTVHEKSVIAMTAASDSLKRVPTEETFTRIKVALERSERSVSGSRHEGGA